MVGPVGYWDRLQQYQFDFLKRMGLEPHHTLLDIGCGPLQGGLPLIDYLEPGRYCGIDHSREAIAEAHTQLVRAGLVDKNPFLAVSSSFGREELGSSKYDYVWISQLLYHLDSDEIAACFQQVSARLKPTGRFYGDIIGSPRVIRHDASWNGYRFFFHSFDLLEDLSRASGLRMTHLGQIGDFGYPQEIDLRTNDIFEFRKK
jgi:SAM-dependent methyltransferase